MLKFLKSRKKSVKSESQKITLALKYLEEGHLEECLAALIELARHGNAEAEYYLGDINEWVLKKPEEAASCYEKSAMHGYPKSKWCIANLYMTGNGVQKDPERAMRWYHEAAASGVPEAMFTLGESYRTEIFIKDDQDLAKKYYLQSAQLGYEPAKKRYQQFYGELPSLEGAVENRRDDLSGVQKKRKAKTEKVSHAAKSIQTIIDEAEKQGCLSDRSVNFIPEIMEIYEKAADFFMRMVEEADPIYQETLAYDVSRYLFAKGVEGVILWGASPKGNISVFFHPKHLQGNMEIETPPEYRHLVEESAKIGEKLFGAYQRDVMKKLAGHKNLDIRAEMREVIGWMPRLGISYALNQKYHESIPLEENPSNATISASQDLDKEALLDPHLYPFLDPGLQNTRIFLLTITRDEILKSAQKQGLTKGSNVKVPNKDFRALSRLAGDLREDVYHHHEVIQKQIQLPIVNNCFVYAFAKGMEYRLRRARGEEDPGLNYLGEDALEGRAGAQVEQDQANEITRGMEIAWDVFCDFQDNIITNSAYRSIMDGRKLADLIACALFWAGVIGLEYAERILGN